MLFAEPERTAYDLNFRLFRFPVRVHPWFWLVTLIFGSNRFDPDRPEFILTWIAVVFVSILVHELGHALAFRAFGVGSHVVLHSFGGVAVPWDHVRGRGQRIVVALAGPAAGFLLAAVVWASNESAGWVRPGTGVLALVTYRDLLYVNISWGLVNLLPVFPLDGGRVSEEVFAHFLGRRGTRAALQLSVWAAGAAAVYSLLCMARFAPLMELLEHAPWWVPFGGLWTLVLFGVLAYQSYQMLQQVSWTDTHWEG